MKFTVCGANGPISDPAAVFQSGLGEVDLINTVRGTVTIVNESGENYIPDVAFRWSNGIWIFNMATTNLQQGSTYTFRIPLKGTLPNGNNYIQFVVGIK